MAFKSIFGKALGLDPSGEASNSGPGLVAYGYGYNSDSVTAVTTDTTIQKSGLYVIDDSSGTVDYTLGAPLGTGNVVEIRLISTSTTVTVTLSSANGSILSTYGSSAYNLAFGATSAGVQGCYARLLDVSTSEWALMDKVNGTPSS